MNRTSLGLLLAAATMLSACSQGGGTTASEAPSAAGETATAAATAEASPAADASEAASETTASAAKGEGKTTYPYEIDSCGRALSFKEAPQKIVSAGFGTLPTIVDLGLEDRIVGLTQKVPEHTYPSELEAKLKAMPQMDTHGTGSSHAQVSTEAVLAVEADMTLSSDRDLDFEALGQAGVQNYSQSGYCKNKTPEPAKIDDIYTVVDELATIFDVPSKGEEVKAELKSRIDAVKATDADAKGSAAVIFVTPGETDVWTYGQASMTNVVLETAGLKNVYGDKGERVFQLNLEDLLGKDPDYLLILYVGDDAKAVEDAFKAMPNTTDLKAVKENKVKTMPYAWADPASSLVVDGIEEVANWLKDN